MKIVIDRRGCKWDIYDYITYLEQEKERLENECADLERTLIFVSDLLANKPVNTNKDTINNQSKQFN